MEQLCHAFGRPQARVPGGENSFLLREEVLRDSINCCYIETSHHKLCYIREFLYSHDAALAGDARY